jgi:hypothetical protein
VKALIAVLRQPSLAVRAWYLLNNRLPQAQLSIRSEYGHEDYDWQPSAEDVQDYGWQHSAEYDQENGPRWQPSAEDISAFMDARIAALKAGLRLTPDQEKNWPAFESAVRDMAKARAQRWAMRQHEQPPADPLKGCNSMQTRSATRRQVSKSSLMLRGHSIKVLMTRRSIALNSRTGLRPHHYFRRVEWLW